MRTKKFCIALILLSALFCFFGCNSVQNDSTVIIDNAKQGVATIICGVNPRSLGSGFCIKQGYIVTNAHVVGEEKTVKLFNRDKHEYGGEVVYCNREKDIAIVKTDGFFRPLSYILSDKIRVGQEVYAIGTPLMSELNHTVTRGIISAKFRDIGVNTFNGKTVMRNLIQHDASINSGNSGGALISKSGSVIGMNTLKVSSAEGLGFAICIDECVDIINKIAGGNAV